MKIRRSGSKNRRVCLLSVMIVFLLIPLPVFAGEPLYDALIEVSREGVDGARTFKQLKSLGQSADWSEPREEEFDGHLRHLTVEHNEESMADLYLIRKLDGEVYILSIPHPERMDEEEAGLYEGIEELSGEKLHLRVKTVETTLEGDYYSFARFLDSPDRVLLDQIHEICCTFMLFLIMVGMGLTLTVKDFTRIVVSPRAIMTGAFLQWLLIPLVAVLIAYLLGYHESYPFIFMGMVLIMVVPGGTTSNLMTYFARGDLALSVSLTALSTVLSLFLTPLLLAFYCSYVTDVPIPAGLIMQVIFGLVIIPLGLGMAVNSRWPELAKKAVPYFSILGIVALFIIIGAGILTNLEKFADTERYGLMEYLTLFGIIIIGMFLGAVIPKLFRVSNYQARALSTEIGLRNSILAMTISILLQDLVGDFYSSMFAVSALYGIAMYPVGGAAIYLFRHLLPLTDSEEDDKLSSNLAPDTE